MTSPALLRRLVRLGVLTLLVTVAACTSTSPRPGGGGADTSAPAASLPTPGKSPHTDETMGETTMQITITVGGESLTATLTDSHAGRDLLAQLPVTVDMVDHGGVEKTGSLPQPLSLEGQPDGADPDVGDLGYYAPGHDLVLYYGDQSYFPGIVVLGRLDGDAAQRIAQLRGPVTATVQTR